MQAQIQQVQDLTEELQHQSKESYSEQFQTTIVRVFKYFHPSRQLLRLAILAIENYGFGLLLTLKPIYFSLNSAAFIEFKNQLETIEVMANGLIGNYSFSDFKQLQFLRNSNKQKRKQLTGNLQGRCGISSATFLRSRQFMIHLKKIKAEAYRISKFNNGDLSQLTDHFHMMRQKIQAQVSFNLFEKSYHTNEIHKLNDEFRCLKLRCMNLFQQVDLYAIDGLIQQLERQEQFEINEKVEFKSTNREYSGFIDHQAPTKDAEPISASSAVTIKNHLLLLPQQEYKLPNISQKINQTIKTYPNHLCCRTFFYENQIVEEAESLRREYKFYTFPFSQNKIMTLCKTIVGFLNSAGGIIYLGIKEESNRLRKTTGISLNEREKEELLVNVRQICEKIYPDIIFTRLFQVKFVPIKTSRNVFVSGKYIVKIIIQMGKPKELYYMYFPQEGARVAFRTQNEVLVRDPRYELNKILEIAKNRVLDPPREVISDHDWQCPEAETGLAVYGDSD